MKTYFYHITNREKAEIFSLLSQTTQLQPTAIAPKIWRCSHSSISTKWKTRLEPPLRVGIISRIIFTPPTPVRGEWGRFVRAIVSNEKSSPFGLLLRLSGKRESVHLLSTLYIKQLPLPSTILPIRGTLGSYHGVVFESDYCHTNFRTTVAYDKFTNNF